MFKKVLQKSNQHVLLTASVLSFFLVVIKASAFFVTGSLLVLGSLFDSLADSVISLINHYVQKASREQADKEHPFGHGGFEVIASLTQGMIIGFFGISLFVESVRKLFFDVAEPTDDQSLFFAISVLVIAAFGGFCIQWFLDSKLRELQASNERSLTVFADKAHYTADIISNLGSALGLVAVYFTQIWSLDAVFGVLSALMLIKTAVPILRKTLADITHVQASPEIQQKIVDIILSSSKKIKGIHLFRSREFGPHIFVDFHLKLESKLPLIEAHEISDNVEMQIKREFPSADVLVHLDPESERDPESWDPDYTINKN